MAKLENRFIRIEDWEGNRYYPDSNSDISTAGIIFKDASTEPNSDPWTQGTVVSDSRANSNKALELLSGSSQQVLFQCTVPTIPFGKVVIGPRLKISGTTTGTDTSIIKLQTFFRDFTDPSAPIDQELDSYIITGKKFTNGVYTTVPRSIEYNGTAIQNKALLVKLIVLPSTSTVVWFDQMYVAMEIGLDSNLTSNNVQNRTLILS